MRVLSKNLKKNEDIEYIEDPCPKMIIAKDVMLVQEDYVINGVTFKRLVKREVDPCDNFKGYKVSDFCIENLTAAGALPDKLMQYGDDNYDIVLSGLDNLSNEVKE